MAKLILAAVALLSVGVTPTAAQAPIAAAPPDHVWMVAFDHLNSGFQRSLLGTLELHQDVLRFRSVANHGSWVIPLDEVVSVQVVENYADEVKAIAVEDTAGDVRYLALLDSREFLFENPKKMVDVFKRKGLAPVNARATSRRR